MEPLASKIRPKSLDEFVGQEHLVGPGKPLRIAIEKKELFSFILWGPPGSGKTTLARMYANALEADFYELSAVDSGKEDIKNILGESRGKPTLGLSKPKILFIDEIHRFNKAQQDFFIAVCRAGRTYFNWRYDRKSELRGHLRIAFAHAGVYLAGAFKRKYRRNY